MCYVLVNNCKLCNDRVSWKVVACQDMVFPGLMHCKQGSLDTRGLVWGDTIDLMKVMDVVFIENYHMECAGIAKKMEKEELERSGLSTILHLGRNMFDD